MNSKIHHINKREIQGHEDRLYSLHQQHSFDVVRNIGVFAITVVAVLNGAGALCAAALGVPSYAFVGGVIVSFAAFAIVYLIASIGAANPAALAALNPTVHIALMLLPSAMAVLIFCVGASTAFAR